MELGFRQLRVVRAIAETGTLSAAAAALGLTQPTVTDCLRRAERVAGGPLFHRDRRGARITPLGDLVVAHARAVLGELARLESALDRNRYGTLPDPVRICGIPGQLVGNLAVAVPRVLSTGVEVRGALSVPAALDLLADLRLEMLVVVDFPGYVHDPPPEVGRATVAVEPMFVAVAEHHRLAGRAEIGLAELAGERWLSVADTADLDDTVFTGYLGDVCRSAGFTPEIRTLPPSACAQLCELGEAVLPMVPAARRRSGIEVIPLRDNPLRMTTRLYWHERGPLAGDAVRALWEELVRAQHAVMESPDRYRAWLAGNPQWTTTVDSFEEARSGAEPAGVGRGPLGKPMPDSGQLGDRAHQPAPDGGDVDR
ncbi:LysR family transcriptional regulator [Amycolatopsis alba]|uniref:LysR family transcriptional regulator n=1 Tax=Amycolatopsis alba TaxID=76020 RepID=UPI000366D9E1|nr:LysR family transcriptional regulator [Amycolatopsis alba]